jgi:hypothetical protein
MKQRRLRSLLRRLPIAVEVIERKIFLIRGDRVMLDRDLAGLYGVRTKAFNQAVKRNSERFPPDFMFQLTREEAQMLRSQFVTASRRNIRYRPYAFTEQGVAMLSSVLRSRRAVQVNIVIMRAFVRLRGILATHKDLTARLDALEKKYEKHDARIAVIFDAIRRLIEEPEAPGKHSVGFLAKAQAQS